MLNQYKTFMLNQYKTKIESKDLNDQIPMRLYLDSAFQGVGRLFVLAFDNTDNGNKKVERNSHTKYFFPRVNINDQNVETVMMNQLMSNQKM